MKTTFKVEGFKELDASLAELIAATNSRTGKAALKRGLIKAAEPMAERARQLAPVASGELKKSIVVSGALKNTAGKAAFAAAKRAGLDDAAAVSALRDAQRADKRSTVEVYVGVAGKASRKGSLVEFGTKPHTIKPRKTKGGKLAIWQGGKIVATAEEVDHPGARPHPFMRPAFESTKAATLETIKTEVAAEIDKAARRAAKKKAKG